MNTIRFGRWAEVLAGLNLPERQKASWTITLRWYLSFCRRSRADVTVQSARDFITWAQREKNALPWRVERWKEAIRWYFRAAKEQAPGFRCQVSGARETRHIQHQTPNVQRVTAANPAPGTSQLNPARQAPAWKTVFLTVVRRRHHVSDWEFQRKIKEAGRKAKLNKRVTPHVLRHSFASQTLDAGYDIRTVQELLGHKSVDTRMIYTHVMRKRGLGVKSPLDGLESQG